MNKAATLTLVSSIVAGRMATTVAAAAPTTVQENNIENESKLLNNGIINSFKEDTEKVGEHNISYLIRDGKEHPDKTYVLAHGATATKEFVKVYASELAKQEPNSRIILVDLPLHGESTGPMDNIENITVHDYADVMYDFLQQKTEDGTIQGTVNWTGWSMGGSVGMLVELKGADIDELTLLNSSPIWEFTEGLLPILNLDNVRSIYNDIYGADFQTNLTEDDIRDQLKNIDAKTLIFGSTQDVASLTKYNELMDAEISDSKVFIYDEGHSQF